MTRHRQFLLLIACALLAGAVHGLQPESQSAASKSSNAPRSVRQSHQVVNEQKKQQPYTKTGAIPHQQQVTSRQGQPPQRSIPPQPANGSPSDVLRNSSNPSQPAQTRGFGVAKHAPLQTPSVVDALPIRPPGLGSPGAMSQKDVRHHSPNPSVLGGAASSKPTNTASISGSAVHHRP
jgi:hypothetical protein